MKSLRLILLTLSILVFLVILLSVMSYTIITQESRERLYSRIDDVPEFKVGVLLGTSPVTRSGNASKFFSNRIDAAVRLFDAGKIDIILATGDNGSIYYNEPIYMQRELMERGIPESRIVLDYAGFSTLDSVIRAREVFGENRFIIISQEFHNERAVFIATRRGIDAYGFNARAVDGYAGASVLVREVLARVKAFLDIYILRRGPRFLGEPEPIPQPVTPGYDHDEPEAEVLQNTAPTDGMGEEGTFDEDGTSNEDG